MGASEGEDTEIHDGEEEDENMGGDDEEESEKQMI